MLVNKLFNVNLIYRSSCVSRKITTSFHKIVTFNARSFATEVVNEKKDTAKNINHKLNELQENWMPIYRYPKIRAISVLNKLKNYQILASTVAIPVSFFVFPDELFVISYSALALAASLSFGSFLIKNSIGVIYVHKKDENLVRIAYISFWGARKDSEFAKDEIIQLADLPKKITDKFYTTLKFKNGHEEIKLLSTNSHIILDPDKFLDIFGDE